MPLETLGRAVTFVTFVAGVACGLFCLLFPERVAPLLENWRGGPLPAARVVVRLGGAVVLVASVLNAALAMLWL